MNLLSMSALRFWSNMFSAAALGAALQSGQMSLVAMVLGLGIIYDYHSIKKGTDNDYETRC